MLVFLFCNVMQCPCWFSMFQRASWVVWPDIFAVADLSFTTFHHDLELALPKERWQEFSTHALHTAGRVLGPSDARGAPHGVPSTLEANASGATSGVYDSETMGYLVLTGRIFLVRFEPTGRPVQADASSDRLTHSAVTLRLNPGRATTGADSLTSANSWWPAMGWNRRAPRDQ